MVATRGGVVDSALMLDEDAKEHIREGMELKERFGKWVVNGGGYANNVRSEGRGGGVLGNDNVGRDIDPNDDWWRKIMNTFT